jgi:hypothetical protein
VPFKVYRRVKTYFHFTCLCFNFPFTELLSELARREKQAGIYPEADVDLFMKVGYTSFT